MIEYSIDRLTIFHYFQGTILRNIHIHMLWQCSLSYNHSRVRPDHNLYTNPFTTITTITLSYLWHTSKIFSIFKRFHYCVDDDNNDGFSAVNATHLIHCFSCVRYNQTLNSQNLWEIFFILPLNDPIRSFGFWSFAVYAVHTR